MPRGIIVLDGPDGSGKTTLAKNICEQYGAKYLHLTYRFPYNMDLYHLAAINFAEKHSQNGLVVIDRWWMSEIAYANAYRKGSRWPLMGNVLSRIANSNTLLYVLCIPENIRKHLDDYEALFNTREEMYKDISPVVIEYHKLREQWKHFKNLLVYDRYKFDGEASLTAYAQALVEVMEPKKQYHPNMLGDIEHAEALLLYGTGKSAREQIYSKGSYHVAKALQSLGMPEYRFMHSNYLHDPRQANELIAAYDIPVICFGQKVYGKLFENHGGGAKAWRALGHPQMCIAPDYDLSMRKGKELRPQLGKALLTCEILGNSYEY